MNSKLIFFSLFFTCFIFFNSVAQISIDFEFLDHRTATSRHLESKIMDHQMLYVSSQDSWPMTTVNLVDSEHNKLDQILGSYYGQTDLREFSDGTFDLFLHSMFDYDVCVSGFLHVAYNGSEFFVDTLHSYILDEEVDSNTYPHSVAKIDEDSYYLIDYDYLYYSDKVQLTQMRPANYQMRLFQNDNRDVYIYEDSLVVKINGNTFDTIQSMPAEIFEIKNEGLYNDVLYQGMVQRWNDDFSNLEFEWQFQAEPNSFYQVHIQDSILTVLNTYGNTYEFYKIVEGESEELLHSGVLENEELNAFHHLDDNSILSINSYILEDIDISQLLIRNYSFTEERDYESRLVAIDSFSIYLSNSDTLDTWINSNGDTIYFVEDAFHVDVFYTNQSDTSVQLLNLISSDFYEIYYFGEENLNYISDTLLDPNESNLLTNIAYQYYGHPNTITMGIPGADFRINHDPDRLYTTDVILNVKDDFVDIPVSLYPNPVVDVLNIQLDEDIDELTIYNAHGKLILLESGYKNLTQLDLGSLLSGIYFLRLKIKGNNQYVLQRFVKS